MVRHALEELQVLHQSSDDVGYRDAFDSALDVVGRNDIAIDMPPEEWPNVDALDKALAGNYSAVLERMQPHVRGKADLVLDVIRVPELYGSDGVDPDSEHRMVAALISEGVIAELVTTNWDPLVERAVERSCGAGTIDVVAHPDDIGAQRPSILKIHGCAKLASENRARFGQYIVVTGEQVDGWAAATPQFKEALSTLLRARPVVFLGCSCRDSDIRQAVMLAKEREEPFAVDVPRAVFVGSTLTAAYEAVLGRLHGDSFAGADAARLKKQALVELYAEELLAVLWVRCLSEKGRMVLELADPPIDAEWVDLWNQLVRGFEEWLDERLATEKSGYRWRIVPDSLMPSASRFASVFLNRRVPETVDAYLPMATGSLADLAKNRAALHAGFHLPLIGLSALLAAAQEAGWPVTIPVGTELSAGQLELEVNGLRARVFFLGHSVLDYRALVEAEAIDEDRAGDCLFVFARGQVPEGRRRDVYKPKLPHRAAAEVAAFVSVESEIIVDALSVGEAIRLIAERVPVGGAA